MKYYRMLDDVNIENRWWLGELMLPDEFDFWDYLRSGKIICPPEDVKISINNPGKALDITMAAFEILIVNEKAKEIFNPDEVQFIPVSIQCDFSGERYYIMVTLFEEECVDQLKSSFERYATEDEIRPDLAGQYSGFSKLVINRSKHYAHNIFRVKDFDVAIIVSEEVKRYYEKLKLEGVKFLDVN